MHAVIFTHDAKLVAGSNRYVLAMIGLTKLEMKRQSE